MRRDTKEYTVKLEDGLEYTAPAKALCNMFGKTYSTVMKRLYKGWTIEQALEIAPHPEQKIIHVPISAAEKIQRETVERKVPRRKKRKIVFYHCTAGSGYWDYERRDG